MQPPGGGGRGVISDTVTDGPTGAARREDGAGGRAVKSLPELLKVKVDRAP